MTAIVKIAASDGCLYEVRPSGRVRQGYLVYLRAELVGAFTLDDSGGPVAAIRMADHQSAEVSLQLIREIALEVLSAFRREVRRYRGSDGART